MNNTFSTILNKHEIEDNKQATVEEIALAVGYSNTSGFYKQFFSIVGMKSSEYRNILK